MIYQRYYLLNIVLKSPIVNLSSIFSNPQLQKEIGKNPQKKIELLENILNNNSSLLSPQHRVKINQMLLETKREFQQKQRQNFMRTNIGTQKQNRSKTEIAQSRRQEALTREALSKNYSSDAEEEEARFKIEEDRMRQLFYEKQRQRRFEYESKLKQLKVNNVNSLRLFNLNENFTAYFSNYGKVNVDIFAPGVDIYSSVPNNKYKFQSGTSMASPVVSGIASLIMSYFPKLSAKKVKEIILESGIDIDIKIGNLGGNKHFREYSKSGKLVNAYNALILASRSKRK